MAVIYYPGVGIDAETGRVISGWPHLKQSLGKIFTTQFGERVMREWFGSAVPHLLGENMIESSIFNTFYAIAMSIDVWEPRANVRSVKPISVNRNGKAVFLIEVDYMPRGHLGDKTVVAIKRAAAYGAPSRVWRIEDDDLPAAA